MSYSRVGNVLMTQGNLTEALKSYQDSVSIRDRLAKADSNGDRQRDLATSQGRVAVVLSKQGDATGALGQLRRGAGHHRAAGETITPWRQAVQGPCGFR